VATTSTSGRSIGRPHPGPSTRPCTQSSCRHHDRKAADHRPTHPVIIDQGTASPPEPPSVPGDSNGSGGGNQGGQGDHGGGQGDQGGGQGDQGGGQGDQGGGQG